MAEEFDLLFGSPRDPSEIAPWEEGRTPNSLSVVDDKVGARLAVFGDACAAGLFSGVAISVTFIWAVSLEGTLVIAVEELAELPDGQELTGHPRRRNFPRHPSEEKKLGHPCLVGNGSARIAGELFLDWADTGALEWHMNTNSGRYCRQAPPSVEQESNMIELFKKYIDREILPDSLEDV